MHIIISSKLSVQEALLALESAERKVGLKILVNKEKHIIWLQATIQSREKIKLQTFKYLGSCVNCNSNISQEINKGILLTSIVFHGLKSQLKLHIRPRHSSSG
jgi:hypothetical protein